MAQVEVAKGSPPEECEPDTMTQPAAPDMEAPPAAPPVAPEEEELYHADKAVFQEHFNELLVKPIQRRLPSCVTPNGITFTNIIVKIVMMYLAWAQSERPTPFSGEELVGRGCAIAFLFFLSEVLDDLDGIHARTTKRGSKFGEVFDHTVDAFGTPLLMATVGMSSQVGLCALAFSVVGGTIIFNLELVLYQRSGQFIELPGSPALSVVISSVWIVLANILIAALGREHTVVEVVIAAVTIVFAIGIVSNVLFFLRLIVKNEARLVKVPHAPKDAWRTSGGSAANMVVRANAILLLLIILFLMQCVPKADDLWHGADMVLMQSLDHDAVPHKWFSPLAFVCVVTGVSMLINGGLVQNCALGKYHPNFHWLAALWLVVLLACHIVTAVSDAASIVLAVLPWCAAGMMLLFQTIQLARLYHEVVWSKRKTPTVTTPSPIEAWGDKDGKDALRRDAGIAPLNFCCSGPVDVQGPREQLS